jgi:hypothetical protein
MRFEEVTNDVYEVLEKVREKYFPELLNAKIKLLFDTKKRTKGSRVVLANIRKTNDLLKLLTAKEAKDNEGFTYIVTVDKIVWQNIDSKDKIRLLRHELRHTSVSIDDEKDPYKIVEHDIQDFIDEVTLNNDDPGWAKRVAGLAEDMYDQMKEQEKAAKRKSKKSKRK